MSETTLDLAGLRAGAEMARGGGRWYPVSPEIALALLDRLEAAEDAEVRLSHLLCDLTGGRLSKTTYDVRTMVSEIEEHLGEALDRDDRERAEAAEAAIERVRALHRRYEQIGLDAGIRRDVCEECSDHDRVLWPCPTIEALGGPSETPPGLELPGDVPSPTLLRLAQEHLTCQSTGGPEAYCLRHGNPFTSAWPCEEARDLAAVLARVAADAWDEGHWAHDTGYLSDANPYRDGRRGEISIEHEGESA